MNTPRRAIDLQPSAEPGAAWGRIFHTLRWIPPHQLAALVRQRVRMRFERPAAFASRTAPADPGVRWTPDAMPESSVRHDAEALRAGRFTFLNQTRETGWPPRWEDADAPRLWQYNLHYFEFLDSLGYADGRELILDWIARHGLARGRVGWEPYPTSLRLLAWCSWLFGRHRASVAGDAALGERVWPSLWLQAEWLSGHLETHLRANHLLENAAALAFCGACFGGPGEAWLEQGLAWLDRELPEQMLADGTHFERSPMYHARVVHVLGLLAATRETAIVERVTEVRARARAALAHLCHPDGEIALLNDAAFGIAPRPSDLLEMAPPDGPFALAQAGYYGARARGHYVVCDAAPIGPDYNPGHAHADLLSFELSLAGQRVLVDAGVHGYDDDPLRAWCRSTRSHNTVTIEDADQCEMWGTFRVGRRGRPRDVVWRPRRDGFDLTAWHDGYERLPGRPRHARAFRWFNDGLLMVRDRVWASRSVSATSRFHLHPACSVEEVSASHVRIRHPGGVFQVHVDGDGELSLADSVHCPEFGRSLKGCSIVLAARGFESVLGLCISAADDEVVFSLDAGARVAGRLYAW